MRFTSLQSFKGKAAEPGNNLSLEKQRGMGGGQYFNGNSREVSGKCFLLQMANMMGCRGVLLAVLSVVEVWIFSASTHSLPKLGCIL